MLCSLYENNKGLKMIVHLLIDHLSQESKDIISSLSERYGNKAIFYTIDSKLLDDIQLNDIQLNGKQMYSIATYYRMFLPSLLPQNIDRILYLDCDIIVMQNVSELFNLNMDEFGVAAVKDASPYDSYHRHKMGLGLQHSAFCAGMMMINLKYWRENNSQQKLLEYATHQWEKVYMQDQDALNYVFRNHWLQLSYKWGKTPLSIVPIDYSQKWYDIYDYVVNPCIFHYAAHTKPWLDVWFPDRKYYWKYLTLSGFPNPIETHANNQLRRIIWRGVIRYQMNKYIRPFIPNVVELLLLDIINFIMFIINLFRPSHLKVQMLKQWCQKYGFN